LKFFIYILFIISASGIFAQNTAFGTDTVSTGEILVTANRIKTSLLLAPNMVQLINDKELKSFNSSKLSDALSFTDGAFIRDYGFNSGLKTISLNSTQSEHALIMLDGVKLNNREHAQFDVGTLHLDNISRIEVSKGGSSSLYGSEAIGGVINLIQTVPSGNKKINLDLTGSYGSYDFSMYSVKAGTSLKLSSGKKLNLDVTYLQERARNNYEYNYHNGFEDILKERANSDYFSRSFQFNGNLISGKNSSLKIFTLYNYWNRNLAGVDDGTTVLPAKQIDNDVFTAAAYTNKLSKYFEAAVNLSYKYNLMYYYDPKTISLSTSINSFYKVNTYSNSTDIKYTRIKNAEINAGYELSYSFIRSNDTEDGNVVQGGIYVAGRYKIGKKNNIINFYPSIRYDYYSFIKAHVFSGKLGVNYKPFEKINLAVKGTAGNNFSAPTFNELYWNNLGNKNLLPERSVSFDAGIYYSFNFFLKNTLEVSYFNIRTRDRIVWNPDVYGIWRPANVGIVESRGIDVTISSALELKNFRTALKLNYNKTEALKLDKKFETDPTYSKQLINLPQEFFKSSVNLDYTADNKFFKSISLNLFYTFTGKRYTDFENTRFIPYYELVDCNINFVFSLFRTETSFKFAVNNALNENYQVMPGYPMPLRNYKFQISIKY
jgi:vitamin B12 transporter